MQIIKTQFPFSDVICNNLKEFFELDGVKLCDISIDHTQKSSVYRIIFSLPVFTSSIFEQDYIDTFFQRFDFEPYKLRLMKKIKSICNQNTATQARIFQLGIEMNFEGRILGIKYYLDYGTGTIEDKTDRFSSYIERSSPTSVKQIMDKINSNGYYPVFIGVNDHLGVEEQKLYFRSRAFGHQISDIIMQQITISKACGWNTALTPTILKEMWDMNLYIEGLALSFEKPNEWRLYFSNLPRRVI